METLIIILITMIFCSIFFNIMSNKKLPVISFLLFIAICLFNYLRTKESQIFDKVFNIIENIEIFMIITCLFTLVVSIIEYITAYRKYNALINYNNNIKNEEEKNSKTKLDILLKLFNEPIAILLNDYYLLNKEMQKQLNYNNNTISKNKFNNLIHSNDRNNFLLNTDVIDFRLNINGDYEWFESIYYKEQKDVYCLIRKSFSCPVKKVKTKSFKELFNKIHSYEKKNNDYYLIFFGINNYHELISFYGDEFTNKIIYKHIEDIINLSYVNEENIFLISKYEYVLLLDNNIEYNILLSELENNSSILIKNDIILSSNKIVVKGNVGAIDGSNVKDKNSNNIINKGLELLKLASDEDYSLDYAIFNEIDEKIEYNIKDIDIDLNFDFSKYKKRIQ